MKRTSAAEAVKGADVYGTAEAVPFVQRFSSPGEFRSGARASAEGRYATGYLSQRLCEENKYPVADIYLRHTVRVSPNRSSSSTPSAGDGMGELGDVHDR